MGLDKALFTLVYWPQSESGAGARSLFLTEILNIFSS